MTRAHKVRVLYGILQWAPMVTSKPDFRQYAEAGNLEAFWTYYSNSIRARADIKRSAEGAGEMSFEMLKPAMEAVYKLPTTD
ncbi:MAG: hypothetical protein AB7G23_09065 [Vicinamibacterales bacterium]